MEWFLPFIFIDGTIFTRVWWQFWHSVMMTTICFCSFRILNSSKTSFIPFGIPLFEPIVRADGIGQLTHHGALVRITIGSFQAHYPLVVPEEGPSLRKWNYSTMSSMECCYWQKVCTLSQTYLFQQWLAWFCAWKMAWRGVVRVPATNSKNMFFFSSAVSCFVWNFSVIPETPDIFYFFSPPREFKIQVV